MPEECKLPPGFRFLDPVEAIAKGDKYFHPIVKKWVPVWFSIGARAFRVPWLKFARPVSL